MREPLKLKGVLDNYKSFKSTPIIGTEFPDANLVEWMKASNSDELLRDLAITSGHTHLVFRLAGISLMSMSSFSPRRRILPRSKQPYR